MSDVHVRSPFQSDKPDSGDLTKFGPDAQNADRLFTGGADGDLVRRDSTSSTGASYVAPTTAVDLSGLVSLTGSYADPSWLTSLSASKISGAVATAVLAAAAVVLATPRSINGVSFDGSASITVPAAAGTLTGAALASNVLASSLTSVGTLTTLAISSGTDNIFVSSGNPITTGDINLSIGKRSLTINTSGRQNVALGSDILPANTSGSYNVGIGGFALNANTSGIHNTAVGVQALELNTTGTRNVAVGNQACDGNTTGGWNTAIGYQALATNSVGIENCAIGFSALAFCTGSDNTGIGTSAARNLTTGTENTLVGFDSGYGVVGQAAYSNNTFIGHQPGFHITTGSNNVYVGHSAGYTNPTGSNDVFLGFQAGYWETGSNKLFIDNQKRTNEADARTKALLYGVFDAATANQVLTVNGALFVTGAVGLGVTTSTAVLQLKAGTAAASTAPLKFTSGPVLTTAEAGAVEFLTDAWYGTITTGAARRTFAFLEGPTFTGTPAAPTAAPGANTTQLATTAFVTAAVAASGGVNLTGPITSVGAATAIASQTGTGTTFAMSESPTFTGVPAAPTAALATNTTQLATTAFVTAAVAAATAGVSSITGTANQITASAATGAVTLSLPAAVTLTTSLTAGGAINLITTSTDGLVLQNTTPATSAVPVQISPRLRLRSQVWNTTSVAATNTNDWIIESAPVNGATPSGLLKFGSSLNGAAVTYPLTVTSIGEVMCVAGGGFFVASGTACNFGVGGNAYMKVTASGTQLTVNSGAAYWPGRASLNSPADSQFNITNNGGSTNGIGFDVLTDAVLKVRTRAQTGYATVDCLGLKASGAAGASFGPAAVASITVVNGIVTACS